MFGILASKCRWTGTNVAYTISELKHHFQTSLTKYVIMLPEHRKVVEAAAAKIDWQIEMIVFTDILKDGPLLSAPSASPSIPAERSSSRMNDCSTTSSRRTLHDLIGIVDEQIWARQIKTIRSDQVAVLQSTSGTTGLPKMAARTHHALILENEAMEDNNSRKPYEIRRLFCTPIFHGFSFPVMVLAPFRQGIPTYIMRKFDETFAQKVNDFQITEIAAAPPMLKMLQERTGDRHLLQSLRMILCGGAPLASGLRDRTLAMFHCPPRIVQVWGMTEGGWFSTYKHPEDDTTGSVGRVLPNLEVKVSMHALLERPSGGEAGELLIRGGQVMVGYFGDAQASNDIFAAGWLRTGDVGYVEDGKIYVIERCKDLIKVNAWQVAPAEIEAALLGLPGITDAAAVGIGDGLNERPLLFVVRNHQDEVNEEIILNHLRCRVARYKINGIELEYVSSIPRNPSGKILRNLLREKAAGARWGNARSSTTRNGRHDSDGACTDGCS